MQNKIVFWVVVLGVVGAGIWWATNPNTQDVNQNANIITTARGELSVEETSFDFGTISMARGKVSRVVSLKNSSTDFAAIKKVYTSCMCTTAELTIADKRIGVYGMPGHGLSVPAVNKTVASGEAAKLEITFDPAAHGPAGIGKIDRVVYVETGSDTPIEIRFTATVTP